MWVALILILLGPVVLLASVVLRLKLVPVPELVLARSLYFVRNLPAWISLRARVCRRINRA